MSCHSEAQFERGHSKAKFALRFIALLMKKSVCQRSAKPEQLLDRIRRGKSLRRKGINMMCWDYPWMKRRLEWTQKNSH